MAAMVQQSSRALATGSAERTAPRGGEVVPFVRKRPRGRPKRAALMSRPCQDSFSVVAAAVVGIANQRGVWVAAKERVRHWADRERGFSPATPKVLGYLLEHVNREKGFDWHSAETIAAELGLSVRTVERAFRELRDAGYILREHIMARGSKASKRWRTTLPKLVSAGLELAAERSGRSSEGPDRKCGKDPTQNGEGPDKQMQEGPDFPVGQIREEEPESPPNPPATATRRPREGGAYAHLLEQLRAEGKALHIVEQLIAPLLRLTIQNPDPIGLLRDIRDHKRLAELPEAALAALAERLKDTREKLTAVKNVVDAIPLLVRPGTWQRSALDAEAAKPEGPTATAEDRQRWDRARNALRTRLGDDVAEAWFRQVSVQSFVERTLVLTAPVNFIKSWIEQHYWDALLEACATEFDGVGRVSIALPPAPRQPNASNVGVAA